MARIRKPILVITGKKGYGAHICQYCNTRTIAYNVSRHEKSKSHLKQVAKYEKENHVVVIENVDKKSIKQVMKELKSKGHVGFIADY